MVQISIIGAGSAVFSSDFVRDLCGTKSLWDSTVVLMDVKKDRLDMAHAFATRYRKETKADLSFTKTTDRRKALQGADFVLCTVKVGGYEPMEAEREIAERHGFYRGIGDRVNDYYGGIGAYHQLKFFLDLARDMEEVCPESWLIETANPVFEGTTLVATETKIKVVGVCHGHFAYKDIVNALGLDRESVTVQMAGFNHCIWLTKFLHNGQDAYPLIDEWIKNKAERYWKSREYLQGSPWSVEQLSPAAVDMYRMSGLFPIGDTLRSASPWWYHSDLEAKKRYFGPTGGFDSEIGWKTYLKLLENSLKKMKRLMSNPAASLMKAYGSAASGEQHIPLIDAIANDKKAVLYLNVPNKGAISNISDDVAVEIPTNVSAKGIRGTRIGKLPERLVLHVMMPRMQMMERTLQAFLNGDRRSLLLTILDDPRARSFETCKALLDELLAQPWNSEAAAHYRW
ncbi:MAG TPA: alpha-glucosidase/alpha-galactosidase [Candidatus Bathyarchaeia archaeon]|nr:alpha-glucosidase/alpha-galactosidase [Candidatus Bathyarchaeia archaeon]